MNKVILIGNLTRDVEVNETLNGIKVARFTLAVQRRFTNADGEREADFINIVAWRQLADTCETYIRKGSKVAVSGAIQTRTFEAQDGTKRYITEVVAEEVEFLNRVKDRDEEQEEKSEEKAPEQVKLEPIDDDDLPF